ncbi:MAG: RNA methyltransferase [Clostridiales bacterium]|nr:RNA methyltransferase [Clostridiales bacterium]
MEKATKNFILNLKKQKRENKSLLFLDNTKIICDAIKNKTINVECILTSLEVLPFETDAKVYKVDNTTIEQLSDTKTPQKVLCVAYYTQNIDKKPKTNFLVLDGLQDPGNVGTLIRSAFASGFEYVYLIDSVRKSNSKLIRSTAGAIFNANIFEFNKTDFMKFAEENQLNLICCDMNGENIFEFKTEDMIGIVVGNEGQGVSEELTKMCYKTVKIPMKKGIESLNAGVSGSIIMFEINKNKI